MIFVSIIKWFMLVATGYLAVLFAQDMFRYKKEWKKDKSSPVTMFFLGMFVDFLDSLGVGAYATTIALNKVLKQIRMDKLLGTLAVGVSGVVVTFETWITLQFLPVEGWTLLTTTLSAIVGGWIGAHYGSKLSEKKICLVLGPILVIIAFNQIAGLSGLTGNGTVNTAIGLTGYKLGIACFGIFILGILQSLGLGMYAPIMALMLMLGMQPKAIYPIMKASSGFAVIFAAVKFVKEHSYQPKASLFIMMGGLIGAAIALTLVKELPVKTINWVVSFILIAVGFEMFYKGLKMAPDTRGEFI